MNTNNTKNHKIKEIKEKTILSLQQVENFLKTVRKTSKSIEFFKMFKK